MFYANIFSNDYLPNGKVNPPANELATNFERG